MKKNNPFFFLLIIVILSHSCKSEDELFFTFLHTNPNKPFISQDSIQKLQTAHMDNIVKLAEEGIIIAAGPFEGGGGMFIFKMKSLDEVEKILETDPAIAAKRFLIENHPMKIEFGNIYPVDTNYTMTFYEFLWCNNKIPDIQKVNELISSSDSIELINLLHFLDNKDKILLLKNNSMSEIKNDFLELLTDQGEIKSRKKLWIAKETFESIP